MTKRILKPINVQAFGDESNLSFDTPSSVLELWKPVKAAKKDGDDDDRIININQEIGERFDGAGITLKMISGRLKKMGSGSVTVNINSPGGSFFEGLAIYNALREHDGEVNTNVLGVAASAASLIAMASDNLRVGKAAYLMVHNSWAMAIGNRHDMQQVSDQLADHDQMMAGIYADRSGMAQAKIHDLMDKESFLGGEKAVELGLADGLLSSDEIEPDEETPTEAAIRRVDLALMKDGLSRSQRRETLNELFGSKPRAVADNVNKPGAVQNIKPCADESIKNLLTELSKELFQ